MSARRATGRRAPKKKPNQRIGGGDLAMFDQSQIQELKEAFNMIDHNRDGLIDESDLREMLTLLGLQDSHDKMLQQLQADMPGESINFNTFLQLFSKKLAGTDSEDTILNAFSCFDEEGTGSIHEDRLREILMTMGDRFSEDEVDYRLRNAPVDNAGNIDYIAFTKLLKHGVTDD